MKVYTSDQIVASLGGIPLNSGRSDGVFIEIEMMNPLFSTKVGADGETARSRSNDHRAKIKITLLQTSDSNILMSALHNLDRFAPNGAGVAALYIQDLQGTSLHTAAECWITKFPDVKYGPEIELRVWELECADLINLVGGN